MSSIRSDKMFYCAAAAIAAIFAVVAWVRASPATFGVTHDDTLYFASAKALAEGRGYILPSLPDGPPQTKYPPLYPWILSWVWKAAPEFPANLEWARAVNLLFGAVAAFVSVLLIRRLGFGYGAALMLGALAALHPYNLFWTTEILSDIVFCAWALAALLAGDIAVERIANRRPRFWPWWAAAITLAWLAVLTRSFGMAIVLGLAAAALVHRRHLAAAAMASALLPLAPKLLALGEPAARAAESSAMLSGYEQNLLYYLSYGGFWLLCMPDPGAFFAQFQVNLTEALKYPSASAFLLPASGLVSVGMQAGAIAASVVVLRGVWGTAQQGGLRPWHWAFLASMPISLAWNYPLFERFWAPWVPLLVAGAFFEMRRLVEPVRRNLRSGRTPDRIAALCLAAVFLGLAGFGLYRWFFDAPRAIAALAAARSEVAPAKLEAFEWLRRHARRGTRVVAWEDGALHLHTGLEAMRPIALSTEAFARRDERILERDLAALGHTAEAIGARYWLYSQDDYFAEGARERVAEATRRHLSRFSAVFESSDGKVRIYRLDAHSQEISGASAVGLSDSH